MLNQDQKSALAKLLYEKSYSEGQFTLTSGRKSNCYFDCRQTSLHPEGAFLIGSLLYQMIQPLNVHAVAGMTMGADPLVTATSLLAFTHGHFLPALIVRKEPKGHGAGRSVEGLANIAPNQSVVVLEDVISTGGSVLKACKRLEEAELKVAAIFGILNREEGGTEAIHESGYPLQTIFTHKELVTLATS